MDRAIVVNQSVFRLKQIALSDAGLAANQVTKMKTKLNLDDGVEAL